MSCIKDTHVTAGIQTHILLLTCPELESGKLDRSATTLRELYWLPIRERIHFKLALFVYKCLNKTTPGYLSTLLSHYTPPHFHRSTLDITHLNVPRANKVLGQKAFSVAGPMIWNNLPPVIREYVSLSLFRKVLKTHLYPC